MVLIPSTGSYLLLPAAPWGSGKALHHGAAKALKTDAPRRFEALEEKTSFSPTGPSPPIINSAVSCEPPEDAGFSLRLLPSLFRGKAGLKPRLRWSCFGDLSALIFTCCGWAASKRLRRETQRLR